jgi:hypothetical protein
MHLATEATFPGPTVALNDLDKVEKNFRQAARRIMKSTGHDEAVVRADGKQLREPSPHNDHLEDPAIDWRSSDRQLVTREVDSLRNVSEQWPVLT